MGSVVTHLWLSGLGVKSCILQDTAGHESSIWLYVLSNVQQLLLFASSLRFSTITVVCVSAGFCYCILVFLRNGPLLFALILEH